MSLAMNIKHYYATVSTVFKTAVQDGGFQKLALFSL